MTVVYLLLPLALLIAGVMLGFFIWAVRSGQFDDLDTPAMRVLFDDGTDKGKSTPADNPTDEPAPDGEPDVSGRERS